MRRAPAAALLLFAPLLAGCPAAGGDARLISVARGNYLHEGQTYYLAGRLVEVACRRPGAPALADSLRRLWPAGLDLAEEDLAGEARPGWVALELAADRAELSPPGTIVYRLGWRNAGEAPAEDLVICETVTAPQQVEQVQAPCRSELLPQRGGATILKFFVGDLAPGAAGEARIAVRVPELPAAAGAGPGPS